MRDQEVGLAERAWLVAHRPDEHRPDEGYDYNALIRATTDRDAFEPRYEMPDLLMKFEF